MLTDKAIRALKPQTKPYRVSDGDSLFLLVQPTGAKHWVYRYRIDGKETSLSYGLYGEVATSEVRQRHREARALVQAGRNPASERQAAKARSRIEAANSFQAVATEWLEGRRRTLATTTFEKAQRNFEVLVYPWIGKLPIASIEPPDVLACLRRIESGGHHETAHRMKQRISQVYRYAIAHGLAKSNPASDLSDALQPIASRSRAAITDPGEIGGLLRAIETFHGQFATECALKLSPFVFVRPGELRRAEWSEFDLDAAEWRIPGEKMKMREEHVVPLATQAVAILRELHPLTGAGRYLFPGARAPTRPMSENTINAALRRLGYDSDTMCGHGFRALASTRLNEMGWAPDVIERQLAHAERNKVRAAYNRASYLGERRKMMQAWADYLDGLRVGGKVVALKSKAG
jgi:integrase